MPIGFWCFVDFLFLIGGFGLVSVKFVSSSLFWVYWDLVSVFDSFWMFVSVRGFELFVRIC